MKKIELKLPYPPSANSYYRSVGARVLISKLGREYSRSIVPYCAGHSFGESRLSILIEASPPDNRRRDLDNLQKPLLDALEKAGLYDNDSQIDDLRTVRKPKIKNGCVWVTVCELTGNSK